jgi:hypothetical protein
MSPQELRDIQKQQPFKPFRIVLADGPSYDFYHPDLLCVGQRSVIVGLPSHPGQEFYERTVEVQLPCIHRLEPLRSEIHRMSPQELTETLKQRPFEPFRIVMTDGQSYDIRHPDLLMVGTRAAIVGLTGQPGQTHFERSVKVDLLHIIRIEPLPAAAPPTGNGAAGS